MGLASILGIRGARDKPEDRYRGPAYSFFFGRSSSGKVVNERTAMQATAVYSCVRILAEAVASLPVHLYRYAGKGKERVYDHPLYYLFYYPVLFGGGRYGHGALLGFVSGAGL